MAIWQEIAMFTLAVAVTYAVIMLGQHWLLSDAKARDAEAWSYLSWDTSELLDLHRKYVDLVATGKAKPRFLRSLDAAKLAIEMRGNLPQKRTYGHSYTSIDIRQNGRGFDVFYVVDGSELAEGREAHIGRIQPFMSNHWLLRPNGDSSLAWSLDEGALSELRDKVAALNAGT